MFADHIPPHRVSITSTPLVLYPSIPTTDTSHHADMYEATLCKLTRAKLQKLAKVCIAFFSECYRK
ncbi:hypothetical protein CY34DRAFT_807273 [Suillus luteus UH-Slu-Lm8-n1]|uniref:Uncharacterized protein n=1 Tax=Suillus luteus UH-Slu-Lm8-n1 TaxID=930992 RepID=A0A0D0AQV1_9AGAM|nr:hypothetical protein CY34DRAFT_807273 [Suillus luteus UH-Slu-Lm8-n1]